MLVSYKSISIFRRKIDNAFIKYLMVRSISTNYPRSIEKISTDLVAIKFCVARDK